MVYIKCDTEIYDAPNGNVTDYVSKYESGEIYSAEGDYYLIKTYNNQVGYIKKGTTGNLTDTAVVVDISSQTLVVYSGNKIVLTSPIVSGLANSSRETDIGIFCVLNKLKDTYLVDEEETYKSHVDYWMPFNENGEGLHDANGWRSRYGGDIYKTNGSHGCVNMPLEKAAELYDIISIGDSVLVHK